MKTVKLVCDLVSKALENPEKVYKRTNYTCDVENGILYLTHWNSLILRYNLNTKQIEDLGRAYSSSDRDAINNALFMVNHTHEYARIKQGCLELVTLQNV